MRCIYQNKTDSTKLVALISESKTSASHIPLGSGAKIELDYPGLDAYVPHILTRVDEQGNDISHTIMRRAQLLKEAEQAKKEADKKSESKQIEPTIKLEPVIKLEDKVEIKEDVKVDKKVKKDPTFFKPRKQN